MKLYSYRGKEPNFGDELNNWLLPKIFPNFFDDDESELFLGIGSVLFNHHRQDSLKVVFSSGYAAYTDVPIIDESWKIYCVRGPRTAKALNISANKAAGDGAILINKFCLQNDSKLFRCSFIPHWESISRGNWELACEYAGINFIDPRHPVEEVLEMINSSSMVITEAMHGAIVADALRVPWLPILPFHASHRMKWFDWAEALNISLEPTRIWPSSTPEASIALFQRGGKTLKNLTGPLKGIIQFFDQAFVHLAAARLLQVSKLEPMLSSDLALARSIERLETAAQEVIKYFLINKK